MARHEISFEVTKAESEVIGKIASRAMEMQVQNPALLQNDPWTKLDIRMDIAATHCNGNPLRLQDLYTADDFNFQHDLLGIRRHLNRDTGKLENHFSPRFSKRDAIPSPTT